MSNDNVKVAISEKIPLHQNLIIVGDWFVAEAVSSSIGPGYRKTTFTRHAPYVQKISASFDKELQCLLNEQKVTYKKSREYAIKTIKQIIKELKQKCKL